MSETIWKFPLEIADTQTIHVPRDGRLLHVESQDGVVTLWVQVNHRAPTERWFISIVGTGHLIPPAATYLGTAIVGPFVWHVYRRAGV